MHLRKDEGHNEYGKSCYMNHQILSHFYSTLVYKYGYHNHNKSSKSYTYRIPTIVTVRDPLIQIRHPVSEAFLFTIRVDIYHE